MQLSVLLAQFEEQKDTVCFSRVVFVFLEDRTRKMVKAEYSRSTNKEMAY